jgi:hypothetical protein
LTRKRLGEELAECGQDRRRQKNLIWRVVFWYNNANIALRKAENEGGGGVSHGYWLREIDNGK